ncbi:MAG: hypothetical protein J7J79_00570 [Thermoplasmata archaeon]|nr:hypothetical protein [Thermoplasmata archaeon]
MKVAVLIVTLSIVLAIFAHMYMSEVPKCPKCGSTLVWTPLGTKSENFLWKCLMDGTTWRKTYPDHVFSNWKRRIPQIVRDASMNYLLKLHPDVKPFLPSGDWEQEKDGNQYVFEQNGWTVKITFTADFSKADVKVDYVHQGMGIMHRVVWVAEFDNGDFREISYTHAV